MGIGQGIEKKQGKKHRKYQDCQDWTLLSLQHYHSQEWSTWLIQQMLLHMLYLLVRTYAFDAHFSIEADICDPNLTPISICQNFVQIRISTFTPWKILQESHEILIFFV